MCAFHRTRAVLPPSCRPPAARGVAWRGKEGVEGGGEEGGEGGEGTVARMGGMWLRGRRVASRKALRRPLLSGTQHGCTVVYVAHKNK